MGRGELTFYRNNLLGVMKLKTKRRCKLGQECGMSCINKDVTCWKKPPGDLQPKIETIAKKVKEKKAKTSKYVIPSDEEIAKMKVLGQGVFGKVVLDEKNNVAIKIAKANRQIDKEEIEIAKTAGNLGIGPKILVDTERNGSSIIAMEFLKGSSLMDRDRGNNVSEQQTKQIIDTVRVMHSNGISHNDLHRGNVFLQDDGKLKIVDYGMAVKSYRSALREVLNLDEEKFGTQIIGNFANYDVKYGFKDALLKNRKKYSAIYENEKSTDAELKSAIDNYYKDIYNELNY